MKKSEQLNELFAALSKAQGEICNAKKDSVNPFFKSKYADLAEVLNVSKEALASNDLCVTQMPSYCVETGVVTVTTIIGHSSGQWVESEMDAVAEKMDAQTLGKLITYLRRYSYSAVVGIAQEDDDGNEAAKKAPQKATQKATQKPPVKRRPMMSIDNLAPALKYADERGLELEDCLKSIRSKYDLPTDLEKEIVKYYADKEQNNG